MCGHPPELEMLCDECFSKNRHHECKTCTYYAFNHNTSVNQEVCIEKAEHQTIPVKRSCFLYVPLFCKECVDNLDRLCFCCGVQFDKPVDGCCLECR